jgi:dolichyl-phosphate beta-glucosyltransferase
MPRAIVVVPCYNEARRLNMRAIQDYGRRGDATELLFVNDGSRDETGELIEHLQRVHPRRFSCLHLAKNSGKAEAVRQGVLAALAAGADYVGFWDADLATPLGEIELFCRVLDGRPQIDLVIGSRLRLLGHKIERHASRYWLGRLFAATASLALGVRIFDTQCGAKLFRATDLARSAFQEPFLTRWIFDVELFARLANGRRAAEGPPLAEAIYEQPLDAWRDVAGSTLKSRDFFKAFFELIRIWRIYRLGGRVLPMVAAPEQLQPTDGESPRPDRQQAA